MANDYYLQAYHKGQRDARARAAAGQSPTLEVLDEIIANVNIATQEPLGLVNIPMESIMGTKTSGRQSAFSASFMPALPTDTEFAEKWSNLSNIHIEEGIRVPIKAFEYKNKFYIQEGNKRVSVLKFFGAVTIPGTVTRIIPAKDGTTETNIYYDFLDFYRYTGINYIWFTREGSFAKLCTATYKGANEKWSTEDRQNFASFYYMFRTQFETLGGPALGLTPADAILVYLSVHRYSDSITATGATILENLKKMWEEITVLTHSEAVELSLEPQTLPSGTPLLSKILPVFSPKQRPLKIVFLHELDAKSSTWTFAHGIGRRSLEEAFPGQVITSHIDHVLPGVDDEIRIEAAARGGADVIFTTSAPMMPACLKVAARHPDIKFLNCSLNVPHPLVRTYYARTFKVKYLLGMLAGILTKGDEIGYLAHYPIYGTPAGINAFALGVRAVRPDAKIILRWTCLADKDSPLDFSDKPNISVIYGRDRKDPSVGNESMRVFNLYERLPDGTLQDIATPHLHWDCIYKEIVRSILDGTWTNEENDTSRAINYWWGLESGAVSIGYERLLNTASQDLLSIVEAQLLQNNLRLFTGALHAQGHILQHPANGTAFTPSELIHMDWLLENVEGHIPNSRDLIPAARRLVSFQGLPCARE